jgi:hypothetical protein
VFGPCASPRAAALNSSGCDRAEGFPRCGPLAVRTRPRQRHPTARRPLGTRSLRRDRRFTRGAEVNPPSRPASGRAFWTNFPVWRRVCLDPWRTGGWRSICPAGHRSDGAGACGPRAARPGTPPTGFVLSFSGRGALNPPVPRVANLSGARGSRTREPGRGDGGAVVCERRGAPMRIAHSGRGRRSVQAQCAGAHKPAPGHCGTGKTRAVTR